MRPLFRFFSMATLIAISACGGGGTSSSRTSTGYFIDSAVTGLDYVSGSQSGKTGSDGSFVYEIGQPVTFKLGNLVLGTITVDKNNRIFPVDLINGAVDENHQDVSFMARVLQSLDSDNNPANGITINDDGRARINQLVTQANTQLTNANASLSNGSLALVDPTSAKNHLKTNLIKEYAGSWVGSYGGDDQGPCKITIDASGNITGTCTSQKYSNVVANIKGSVSSSGESAAGDTSTGANFSGKYTRAGLVNGTWTNNSGGNKLTGTFALTRQGS